MPMSSIVIFCKTLVKGGAEKQALALARLLTKKGLAVVIVSWSRKKVDKQNQDYIIDNSLKFYGLHGSLPGKLVQFNRILKRENATVVLSYLTLANFVAGFCKFFNKCLITYGGIRSEKLPGYKFIVERFVHNHLNDATVFNNFSAKKRFESRGFNTQKIFVIHNSINIPEPNVPKKSEDEINIITVARFVKAKDFRTALLSVKQLITRNSGQMIKYILVGYGPQESGIRSLIKSLDLQSRVILVINPPNVRDYLRKADIYLSTSLFEGLSNSLMEAMVEGLPIVATDVGDNSFLVKEGFNGHIVPTRDVDQIALRLGTLVKSAELRHTFGANSSVLISKDFNEEKFIINYFKLIGKFAAASPTRQIPVNEKAYSDTRL